MTRIVSLALTALVALSASPARASLVQRTSDDGAHVTGAKISVHGLFTTMGLFRNDSDFDPTPRFYDRDGQTEGQVATYLRPDIRIDALGALSVFYQMELGWNAWSLNSMDQGFPGDVSYPVLKHRELWGEWRFGRSVRLRVGYQHLADRSRLFLDHWGGAAVVDVNLGGPGEGHGLRFLVGQLPDSTCEGVDVRDNNFVRDDIFVGFEGRYSPVKGLPLDAAVYWVGDFRAVDRPLYLATGLLGLRYDSDRLHAWLHLLGQVGVWKGSALGGGDAAIRSWAMQAGGLVVLGDVSLSANVFTTGADDDHDGNDLIGTFFGSAKNRSRTLWLTEDEFRDRYDNLDERVASTWGPFSLNRAGLLVGDITVDYRVTRWFQPSLTLGAAIDLNPTNVMGNRFVAFEASLAAVFPLAEGVSLFAVGQTLVPGRAASVFVNDVDRDATHTIVGVEAGFTARF